MAGEKIAKRLKDISNDISRSSDLTFGKVISKNPLVIRIDNRFDVDENHLILSRLAEELTVNINVSVSTVVGVSVSVDGKSGSGSGSGSGTGSGTNTIWRGLQVGDKVALLKLQKGQIYYVLERV